jgi:hypothetical protein
MVNGEIRKESNTKTDPSMPRKEQEIRKGDSSRKILRMVLKKKKKSKKM